jgi:mannosylglycerate hydrolase
MSDKKLKMHLAINTHWDREYRWSFVETQTRLLEAVDILIDTMEKDSRFGFFHTDSQVSFLEDYLELRPENTERVKKLVKAGRLLTGPWYTLPAEFLVSGEALVRNILMGHKIAKNLGGVMKAGYNIFSWGQVSQLPQMYKQFGIDSIMFYRGIDQSNLDKLEFKWRSPDGTEALGVTFGSYHRLNFWVYVYRPYNDADGLKRKNIIENGGFFFNLCDSSSSDFNYNHFVVNQPQFQSFKHARNGLDTLISTVKDVSSTDSLLFLQGFDQENPDPTVPDLVDKLNEDIGFGKIEISTIGRYLDEVKEGLKKQKLMDGLKTFDGEMLSVERSGDPFAPLYNGVFSARMPLKQMNTDCENRLEDWSEPACVWAALSGNNFKYPYTIIQKAWKNILANQQHDGIGGCHVDRITTTMIERYKDARDLAETVTRESLKHIVADIDYSNLNDKEIGLTVFNSQPYTRTDMVEAVADIPHEWNLRFIPGHHFKMPITVDITDDEGKKIDSQIISLEDKAVFSYLKYGSHINGDVTQCKFVFKAEKIPAMGYKCFKLTAKQSVNRPVEAISLQKNVIENEHIKATIAGDGTIELFDKKSKRLYSNLHYFEDSGEMGGPLLHQTPYNNCIYNTLGQSANIGLVRNGPLQATYKIERTFLLPESLESDVQIHVPHGSEWIENSALKRSEKKAELKITTFVTLKKDSSLLEFETIIDNNIKDHRLRVCFDTGISNAANCWCDSPFDVVSRAIAIPDASGWYEAPAKTLPAHSFVDVSDGNAGVGMVHVGLPEYEVVDNKQRTIALTLLRCFGTAGNNSETYIPQPLAQCQGKQIFKYGIIAHQGLWQQGRLHQVSKEFSSTMRVAQCTKHNGSSTREKSFIAIDNDDFVVTALKKSEDSSDFILRGFNPTGKDIEISIILDTAVKQVEKVNLEEIKITEAALKNNTALIKVGKGEILSLAIRS